MPRTAAQLAAIITNIESGLVILDRDPQTGRGGVVLRPSLKRVLRVVRTLRPPPSSEEIEAALDHLIAEARAAGDLARASNLLAYRELWLGLGGPKRPRHRF